MANVADRSNAFNAARVRADLLARVRIPPSMLQKAIDRLHEELDAKETKFFAHQGVVINKRTVVNHEARQGAIDKILKVAGAYVRESDSKNETPQVAIEIDSKTGVMRLVIGDGVPPRNGGAYVETENNNDSGIHRVPEGSQLALPESQLSLFDAIGVIDDKEEIEEAQVIKLRGRTPPEIIKMLYGKLDEPK